ncbi:MAG: type 2 isopentenyl-diphosphate Delta-isomerase [Ignavibacteriaceae bacterium]|nr:type 2 isopentenyl-diphosphate Delta-isomerase [Ignavibacteriaceae bacterium]
MNKSEDVTSQRKKEHLELSLKADVSFKTKTNGFDQYEFIHNAATDVELDKISFETKFFKKKINYPFIISCMTGGTEEAENINAQLAIAAEDLKIPIGVGSQRQALENKNYKNSYNIIRKNAKSVPVLGNLGAAELVKLKSSDPIKMLIELIEADAFVIHLNPLQELLQPEGNPYFKGFLKSLKKLIKEIEIPVIVKEIGMGISKDVAKRMLEVGVKGIDVAGAGGTSWAAIEMLRNKSTTNDYFWDWGLPTSFCLRENSKLKKNYKFILIGSGGINSAVDAAKAFALGADYVASARTILKELDTSGVDGVKNLIIGWFETIRKIMFLTGSKSLKELRKNKIMRRELLY